MFSFFFTPKGSRTDKSGFIHWHSITDFFEYDILFALRENKIKKERHEIWQTYSPLKDE